MLVAIAGTASGQTIPPAAPTPAPIASSEHRPFTFGFNNLYLFDSNINHSLEDPHETRGAVFGLEATWKTPVSRPNLEISYEIARHFHTAEEWDRLSHDVRAAWNLRLSKHWNVETVGEVSLKGSTEDRDISDQYIFSPRLEYRLTRENRLRAYGAYRIREFDDDPSRDAINRYLGLEYVYRGGPRRLDLGFRYEVNRAESIRHHYTRWSYYGDYTMPMSRRDRLTLEANYRPRRYDVRRVDVDDHDELRFDRNWILRAEVGHLLLSDLEILAGYRFETRSSNDPDKKFNEHTAYVGLRYWFGKGENPDIKRVQPADRPEKIADREGQTKSARSSSVRGREKTAPLPKTEASPARSLAATVTLPRSATSSPKPVSITRATFPAVTKEEWSRRADRERRRLLRGEAGLYAIELGRRCGTEALEDAWRRDSPGGALWLIPYGRAGCFLLFWGRFSSREAANQALASVPGYFRSTPGWPMVVAIAASASSFKTRFP
jgi:hypothetical protein